MGRFASARFGRHSAERKRARPGAVIAICVFPAIMTALFYILRPMRGVMDWMAVNILLPARRILGMLSSIYPPALMEVLCTAAGIFLIYYIIKAIRDCSRRREWWKHLGKRTLWLLVGVCYVYGAFCWLWSSGYHTTGFAEKNGFTGAGVEAADLAAVTQMFAQKANELSVQLERDEDYSLVFNRREMFEQSKSVYANISEQYPSLKGIVYAPKPMFFYSWLMTITGYSGMYFAFTGEAMINTQLHAAYMPSAVAHEHAHQLGIYAEDEANFAGILASVTSGYPVFEYAGYMTGLGYLSGALSRADYEQYEKIMSGLTFEVRLDRFQNAGFWAGATTSNLGVEWLDNILTSVMEKSNTTAGTAYDSYLKSQSQQLGLQSYGACVDLLVEYFTNYGNQTVMS